MVAVNGKTLDDPERSKWVLRVDVRERKSRLLQLVLESDLFDVRVELLDAGDYIINNRVILERKTFTDFALSVVDGRLFVQAAALKKLPEHPLILVEGPKPKAMPRVHPKALILQVTKLNWRPSQFGLVAVIITALTLWASAAF